MAGVGGQAAGRSARIKVLAASCAEAPRPSRSHARGSTVPEFTSKRSLESSTNDGLPSTLIFLCLGTRPHVFLPLFVAGREELAAHSGCMASGGARSRYTSVRLFRSFTKPVLFHRTLFARKTKDCRINYVIFRLSIWN